MVSKRKRVERLKPLLLLVGLLLGWTLLPALFQSFLRISFFEVQAPLITASSHLKDLQKFWAKRTHSKLELIEAGRDLARLNAAYELKLHEQQALKQEIAHLEEILNLPPLPDHRYEVARVAQREINSWWQTFIIRKGSSHGITVGAPVVYSGGIAGRIKEVHLYTSVVELVSSNTFRIAANFEDDDRPITYQGNLSAPFHPPEGEVRHVPTDFEINTDATKRLVSSKLGGVFPAGLNIGKVRSLRLGSDGLFQSATVELDPRLHKLQEVAVLLPFNEDSQEA